MTTSVNVATIVESSGVSPIEYEQPAVYDGKITHDDRSVIRIRHCFGRASEFQPGPQGFIVDMPPDTKVAAHCHAVDQFQVYSGQGGAWYQRTPVDGLLLHYMDAYSTYGPFGTTSGDGSLRYYVLRAKASDRTFWIPQDREEVLWRGRRNYLRGLPVIDGDSAAEIGPVTRVIEPEEDGLAAYLVHVPPKLQLEAPSMPDASPGRYFVMLSGALLVNGREYGVSSLLWQAPGEELPAAHAGSTSGSTVLIVQFPRPSGPSEAIG